MSAYGWFVDGEYVPAVSEVWPEADELAALTLNPDGTPALNEHGEVSYHRRKGKITSAPRPYDGVPPVEAPATEPQAEAQECPIRAEMLQTLEPLRAAIRRGEIRYDNGPAPGVPGLFMWAAVNAQFGMPMGFILYRYDPGKRLTIAYIWVLEYLRRCGLATHMLNRLIRCHPGQLAVVTAMGNELSTPWMQANGFEERREEWLWIKPIHAAAGQPAPAGERGGA